MNSEFMYRGRIISKKVEVDGHVFDSEMESEYYKVLKEKERKGEIRKLKLQESFTLVPPFSLRDKEINSLNYVADFTYIDEENVLHVIDVKGMLTDEFKIKKKIFEYLYRIPLEIVVFDAKSKSWMSFEEREKLKKDRKREKTTKTKELKEKLLNIEKKKKRYNALKEKLKTKGKLTPKEKDTYLLLEKELLGN